MDPTNPNKYAYAIGHSIPPYMGITKKKPVKHQRQTLKSFIVWSREERQKMLVENPDSHSSEIDAKLDHKWETMSEEEKMRYSAAASHIKRPMNPFILWSKGQRQKMLTEKSDAHHAEISVRLGNKWKSLSEEEKKPFVDEAMRLRELHLQQYPEYRYKPKKRTRASPKSKKTNSPPTPSMTSFPSTSGAATATSTRANQVNENAGSSSQSSAHSFSSILPPSTESTSLSNYKYQRAKACNLAATIFKFCDVTVSSTDSEPLSLIYSKFKPGLDDCMTSGRMCSLALQQGDNWSETLDNLTLNVMSYNHVTEDKIRQISNLYNVIKEEHEELQKIYKFEGCDIPSLIDILE